MIFEVFFSLFSSSETCKPHQIIRSNENEKRVYKVDDGYLFTR